jgi:MATE family multidrug resistance protein
MIFGHFGFPAMGLMGSCWASFISRVLMALAMFLYVYKDPSFKKYWTGFSFGAISKPLCKKILAIGVPSGLQWVFEVGAFAFAVIMMGWISADSQAAHQIALSIAATTYMMASGVSAAASVRVGNALGLNDRKALRTAGFSAFIIVLFFMGFTAVCFILFREQLPVLFSKNSDVIGIASSLLVIAAFFQLSDGTQVVALGALRGMKDVKVPTIITLIAYWVVGLPLSYILAFKAGLGAEGIWYGLLIGLTITAVLLYWRFDYVSRKLDVRR